MRNLHDLPRVRLGVFPTPFYRLDRLSEQYGRGIWIKRDDLCGVALGGSKVRKLEFVLAEALDQGCDTVFTTGGAQSNHAALTAACAAAEAPGRHGAPGQSGAGRALRRRGASAGHGFL